MSHSRIVLELVRSPSKSRQTPARSPLEQPPVKAAMKVDSFITKNALTESPEATFKAHTDNPLTSDNPTYFLQSFSRI